MSQAQRILVSGASIAGPAAAYWLSRHGHHVTVVERAPRLRTGGYAVDIRGPALDVIARMGLRETLRPYETDTLGNCVVDARGRRFGRTARGFGVIDPGDVEILRGDLAHVLYEASRAGVSYRFGDSIAQLTQDRDGVDVAFTGGGRERFDLVLGADGVRSQTRALAWPPSPETLCDLGSGMAIFTAPNFLGLDREQLLFQSVGCIASVKSAAHNRELKLALFFATRPGALDGLDDAGQRRAVAVAFEHAGWELPRFMEAMWRADDFYCDVTCQVRLPSLVSGRVALVGDAGYCPSPLSGQGTSLALVGAYLLADALAAAGGDHARAFARYDERMRPFVRRNQEVALRIAANFAPRTPFQVWSRGLAMRLFPYLPGKALIMKLGMRGVRQAAHALTLPAAA